MRFSATTGVNVLACGREQEVPLLLELEAPPAPDLGDEDRAGASVQIVLDLGGSMTGPTLEGALDAVAGMVHRLDARDNFGLVASGAATRVVVPAGPLTDKDDVVDRLAGLEAEGAGDLVAGYRCGLEELGRVAEGAGGTLLVVSDGHAEHPAADIERLGELAREAHDHAIVTSTVLYGPCPDRTELAALSRAGSGSHHVAASAAVAGAAMASEVADLQTRSVQSVCLTVRLGEDVELARLDGDLSHAAPAPGLVVVGLGDLYFEEQRRLRLWLRIGAAEEPGIKEVASLQLRWSEVPSLAERRSVVPVALRVVPQEAAGTARPGGLGGSHDEAPTRPAASVQQAAAQGPVAPQAPSDGLTAAG